MADQTETVERTCPRCGATTEITVQRIDFVRWIGGEKIQRCFPYLDAATREQFITGYCGRCWEEIFGDLDG